MKYLRHKLLITSLFFSALGVTLSAHGEESSPANSKEKSNEIFVKDEWADDDWGDTPWEEETTEQRSPWHGFIQGGYGQFLDSENPTRKNQSLAEVRGRLENSWYFGDAYIRLKAELIADAVTENIHGNIREAFWNGSPSVSLDLRIGRQTLTWGTGDLVFLNDLFPKDWQSFFAGRDMEYLKAPSDAIRLTWYNPATNIDLVWLPFFESDIYLTGERFSYYSPMANAIVAAPPELAVEQLDYNLGNGELALRLYQNIGNFEWAIYGYRGFYKMPEGFNPASGQTYFPRMNSLGASLRGPLSSGIIHTELAFHQSVDDESGTDPWVPNSEWRFLLGYEQELMRHLTLGLQYYLEKITDYQQLVDHSPRADTEPSESRHTFTLRITYLAMQDKLRWSLFSFYSPNDDDAYLIPSVNYRYNDYWSFETGANIFMGDHIYTFLGQLQKNDNVYMRATYRF
ncbi:MAG: hypothetical protein KUG53_03865 [Pseudomonadales bacterium]|nr:hypothetical protein [Pseudomonadales bacterium]